MRQEKYKASKYNYFIPTNDGKVVAFNAMSRCLGQMDKKDYKLYQKIVNGEMVESTEVLEDLLEKLKKGNFLIPKTRDEIQQIKARHYMARFGKQGFGLTIIPTMECNFACDYCFEPGKAHSAKDPKRGIMGQEIQDGIVAMVKSRVPQGTGLGISWYGGEPLLGLEIIESLSERFKKVCEEKKAKYSAGIVTNGYLLNTETLDKLLKCNITYGQVTIDGPEEIHNKRRPLLGGGSTYQTIMHNLERIPEDIHFSVGIRVNIDKRNRGYVPQLLGELKKRNFHKRKNIRISFGRVVADNRTSNDIAENCISTYEFATEDLNLYKEAANLGFRIHIYPESAWSGCLAIGANYFVVEPNGTLHACWETIGKDEMSLGKIEDSILKFSDNYYKWLSYSPFEKKECVNCSVLPICMGGCPYRSLYMSKFSPQQRRTCTFWKYNAKERIKFYVKAYRMGLFMPQEID